MDKATLRASIANDLRDPTMETFSSDQINGFMEDGIVEVSLVYPLQLVEIITPVAGNYYYPIRCEQVFRAEVYENDSYFKTLPMNDGVSQSGIDFHAGVAWVPKAMLDVLDPERDDIRLWGYAMRKRPTTDNEVLELDDRAEFAVRAYAKHAAYQALINDRSLFAQWQVASKNTDITVNQLLQMAANYGREWERKRSNIRIVRRAPD